MLMTRIAEMRFSLDIFDEIIDALGADFPTIRLLCLTSTALVTPAQKRLFSSILLRLPSGKSSELERCEALVGLFHTKPKLASHIRNFKIVGNVWPQTRVPLLPILQSISSWGLLESFAFPLPYILDSDTQKTIPADWHMIFPPIRQILEEIICLQSVQTVVVCGPRNPRIFADSERRIPTLKGLSSAILRVPRLRNLCFTYDDTPSLKYPATARIRQNCELPDVLQWKYLELGGDFALSLSSSVTSDPLRHHFISELGHLALHPDNYSTGREVASICSQALQTLVLLNPRPPLIAQVDLGSLVELQTLVFILNMSAIAGEVLGMGEFLQQSQPTPNLTRMTMTIQIDSRDGSNTFSQNREFIEERLLAHLGQAAYEGIRHLEVKTFDTTKIGEDGYKDLKLSTHFPTLWKMMKPRGKVTRRQRKPNP
ncbi:hypothetical protein DXG01_003979 [Tephrocybe rancida]|nr:hypothetical protein DXG01_003979 [Tephrocybe rancida]